ncbi:unnamed protein product, partial [Cladocopium goreaui]
VEDSITGGELRELAQEHFNTSFLKLVIADGGMVVVDLSSSRTSFAAIMLRDDGYKGIAWWGENDNPGFVGVRLTEPACAVIEIQIILRDDGYKGIAWLEPGMRGPVPWDDDVWAPVGVAAVLVDHEKGWTQWSLCLPVMLDQHHRKAHLLLGAVLFIVVTWLSRVGQVVIPSLVAALWQAEQMQESSSSMADDGSVTLSGDVAEVVMEGFGDYLATLAEKCGEDSESSPQFSALQSEPREETFEVSKSSKKDKALSKLLFMGKFNLTEEQFEQGLRDEEFFLVKDEQGRDKYSWEALEHSHETGSSSKLSLQSSKSLNASQAKLEKAAFSQEMTPKGLFGSGLGALPAARGAMPIEDRANATLTKKQWQQAQGQLLEATRAFDKMAKGVKKHLGILGHEEKDDPIYISLLALQLLVFKEHLAGVRGQLQARAARAKKEGLEVSMPPNSSDLHLVTPSVVWQGWLSFSEDYDDFEDWCLPISMHGDEADSWRQHWNSPCLLLKLPGVSCWTISYDLMHNFWLGWLQFAYGSIFYLLCFEILEEDPLTNLKTVGAFIREFQRKDEGHQRYRQRLEKLSMFVKQSGYPKLKGRSSDIKGLCAALKACWMANMRAGVLQDQQIAAFLELNLDIHGLLEDYSPKYGFMSLPAPQCDELYTKGLAMAQLHVCLLQHYAQQEVLIWNLTSKTHYCLHSFYLARWLHPSLTRAFKGESTMKAVQTLWK